MIAALTTHYCRNLACRMSGLDVGDRRIGLAFGDTDVSIGMPAGVLERTEIGADVEAVLREARERDAGVLVVGMPYTLRGERGPQAEAVETFVAALRAATDLDVVTVDERFSTAEAQARMADARPPAGRKKPRRPPKGADDAAAAAIIVTRWLAQGHSP
ncbi:MAG: Holliday junction resolvase RuvX [Chloroflexi bacterium]|nr:Holliday junction resolvase RuvX [Chloroflexota bacterium]